MKSDDLLRLIRYGTDDDRRLVHLYLNDPYYSFQPRPDTPAEFDQQSAFVNEKWDGIACALAGNASGKTYAAAFKMSHFLRETPAPVDLCKYYMASQTMAIAGTIWQEKVSKFIPPSLIDHIAWHNSAKLQPQEVILKPSIGGNRWMICFRSYEQGRKSFQAISECGGFWVDEQIDLGLLNEIDTRTREFHYPGSKLYTLTPVEPDEELEERVNEPHLYPYWKFYRMNAERNFEFGGIKSVQWLESTPADMRETRRIGDFCRLSGAVFKEFDQNIHVIQPKKLSPYAKYFRSIDFGFGHDTACVLMAEDHGVLYVVKEWGAAGMLIADKVRHIREEMPGLFTTYADPEDRQQREEFARLGLPTTIARKEPVTKGIELIRVRMSQKKFFIFKTCKRCISQMKNYRWKEPKDGQENLLKERPVKRNDDYVDAVRMGVHSFENPSLEAWEAAKIPIGPVSRV